jgi:two-component system chemotaxis response regulator CheB
MAVGQNIDKSTSLKTIVAIGTSTGGPMALQEVVPYIPGNVPAALLIVQHMPSGYTKSLAERINQISELTVKEAENGDPILPGFAYIAPGDYHMEIEMLSDSTYAIKLTQEPAVVGHRPSVNVMMNSLAKSGFPSVVGVIMTGMGADGSEGIRNLKKSNNARIISQDEKSCVVYGMPRAAVLTGVVDTIVPLKGIAEEIVKNLGV